MSEFQDPSSTAIPEMSAIIENLQKKNALTTANSGSRQNIMNSSSSSSVKETSSSQQVSFSSRTRQYTLCQ